LRSAISTQQRSDDHDHSKHERLNGRWHDQDGLRVPMADGKVRQVDQRWPIRRTGVHDLEDCLQVAIEIHCRACDAFERERLIAVIPPSMRNPRGSRTVSPGPNVNRWPSTSADSVPVAIIPSSSST
jgi:hypothetical protein